MDGPARNEERKRRHPFAGRRRGLIQSLVRENADRTNVASVKRGGVAKRQKLSSYPSWRRLINGFGMRVKRQRI
jgi:hypothetical protein